MELKITNRRTQEFEKEFDEPGRISIITFHHLTIKSDEDVRPHIKTSSGSWYNCHMRPEKGSVLEAALTKLFSRGVPGLHGIRSVSEDGLEMEFCWR